MMLVTKDFPHPSRMHFMPGATGTSKSSSSSIMGAGIGGVEGAGKIVGSPLAKAVVE